MERGGERGRNRIKEEYRRVGQVMKERQRLTENERKKYRGAEEARERQE